jgi:lysophospholipase L1-like esterase
MALPKYIAVLGDSIANGYADSPALGWPLRFYKKITERDPEKYGFSNYAIDGSCIIDTYYHMGTMIPRLSPDYLIVAVGINDVLRWDGLESPAAISPSKRMECWQRLLIQATRLVPRVFVMGILPVDESRMPIKEEHGTYGFLNEDITIYNSQIQDLCDQHNCTFVSWQEEISRPSWSSMLHDGLHPNAAGHAFLADLAYGWLKGKI